MVYSMAPFPFPKIVELREKYTYNIHPLSNNLSPEKRVKFNQKTKNGYISSDDEDDDVSQLHIGCLGILSPKTTSEGSAHKVRHSGGYPFTLNFSKPTNCSDNVPRRSRPPVDVSDLEKEYNRTRKMQQQAVVVFSQSNASKSQDLREIPPAINHLFVVTRARRNKWKEHLQKERQRQDKLLPVHEEEEDWERGHVEKHANEHVTDAAEHLVGLFKGATTDESPPYDQDRTLEENLEANLDIGVSLTDQNTLPKSLKSSKDLNTFKIVRYSNPSNSLKTTRDKSRTKAVKTSLSISSVDPSLVLPDKKCIYPAKFFPFPGTRTKVSNNGLLCSKRTETEQPAKKQSFISGPPMPCQARTNR
ncbi:TBC1 domain family member 30-like [Paramuricea clavata]|uniref:TBC1 domain family member 30-like n=1 Tax=Paramuricea clavata TaxID=317549 RepID=A0A6S7JMP0_PARCT|nr:TBC1 domain family member 30-like [Paramuricea clavata]